MYLSHFIRERVAKGLILVMWERWVGDGTDCNILTPSSPDYSSTSSSFCWAAQPGSWGPNPSVWGWFSLPRTATLTPTNWLQLTRWSLSVDILKTPWSQPLAGLARPRVKSKLTSFSKSPNYQPIASGHDVIHTPVLFPIWGFYYDIFDCHILYARVWKPALRPE